jgi:hypothetical protein
MEIKAEQAQVLSRELLELTPDDPFTESSAQVSKIVTHLLKHVRMTNLEMVDDGKGGFQRYLGTAVSGELRKWFARLDLPRDHVRIRIFSLPDVLQVPTFSETRGVPGPITGMGCGPELRYRCRAEIGERWVECEHETVMGARRAATIYLNALLSNLS